MRLYVSYLFVFPGIWVKNELCNFAIAQGANSKLAGLDLFDMCFHLREFIWLQLKLDYPRVLGCIECN